MAPPGSAQVEQQTEDDLWDGLDSPSNRSAWTSWQNESSRGWLIRERLLHLGMFDSGTNLLDGCVRKIIPRLLIINGKENLETHIFRNLSRTIPCNQRTECPENHCDSVGQKSNIINRPMPLSRFPP